MSFTPKSEWQMSIERLNNKQGYTKDNIVLICVEFNSIDTTTNRVIEGTGSAQWSKEKMKILMEKLKSNDNQ